MTTGCCPGCERAALLADGTLAEAPVTVIAISRRAEEIAFLNSVRGWQPRGAARLISRPRRRRSPGTANGRIVVVVQRAGAQRAPRRLLVHEHGTLAVRAIAHAHRRRLGEIVRHRVAHSGGAVPQRIGAPPGALEPPCGATDERRRGGADRPSRHPPNTDEPPRRGALGRDRWSWPAAYAASDGSCACRAGRRSGRARAASSTSTCCRWTVSSRTPARRRRARPSRSCWVAEGSGRTPP